MAGILLLGLAPFNGGRSQVNFNFASGDSGEYPFINYMKSAGTWVYVTGSGTVDPTTLDSDGYPTSIVSGGVSCTLRIPTNASLATVGWSGTYKVTWSGAGTVLCPDGTVTGSTSTSGYTFTTSSATPRIQITTTGVSNLKVFHIEDESKINQGQLFGTQFKKRLAQARFGVYRFLNWQLGNSSMATTWSTRKPQTYYSWTAQEHRSSLYPSAAMTNSGADYSQTFADPIYGSGAPTDKQTIIVKFNASQTDAKQNVTISNASPCVVDWGSAHSFTGGEPVGFQTDNLPSPLYKGTNYYVLATGLTANTFRIALTPGGTAINTTTAGSGQQTAIRLPTLNLNGTGAVPFRGKQGVSIGDSTRPTNGKYATIIYDQTLNSWLKFGGDSADGDQKLTTGVPPEVMLQLCAEMGAHPYFVTPNLAIDPATDFMPSLASHVFSNKPSWMIPRFEGCNELWNSNGAFNQTAYAQVKSNAYGWGRDVYHDWQGKTMSVLGQICATVFGIGNLGTTYQVLCGVQTSVFTTLPITSQNPRLTAAQYVAGTGGGPQSPYTATAASGWVSHVCCAQYLRPTAYGTATETTLAVAYAGGDLTAPGTYVDTMVGTSAQFETLSYAELNYQNIKSWAAGLSVNSMCGYEGGYSPDYNGTNTALRAAGKAVSQLQTYTTTNYANFINAGGEFPSCFQLGGASPSDNAWSVLEDIYQTPSPPQWLAIIAFNA